MRRRKPEGPVRFVHVSARPLIVVEVGGEHEASVDGAIVWLQPEARTTPEEVDAARAQLLSRGAVRVRVLPRPSEDAPIPVAVHEAVSRGDTVRAVVEELLAEVKEQPEAVRMIVEEALAEVGL